MKSKFLFTLEPATPAPGSLRAEEARRGLNRLKYDYLTHASQIGFAPHS